jgi:WD40 repeat protein
VSPAFVESSEPAQLYLKNAAALSPDGQTLVTGDRDSEVSLWDISSARKIGWLTNNQNLVWSLAFSPDGRFLAIGALWFVLDAAVLWKDRPYSPAEMRLFLWGWNIAALLGIFWNWSHGTLTHLHLVSGLQK